MNDMGWINLSRKIWNNFLWNEKPFQKVQAWIDMLLLANYKENTVKTKTGNVTVPRGSFITSDKILEERWGWGRTKVRSFLTLLENESMVLVTRSKDGTMIKIINYDVYQSNVNNKKKEKLDAVLDRPKPKSKKENKYKPSVNRFNDFPQREYSKEHYEKLEQDFMQVENLIEGK